MCRQIETNINTLADFTKTACIPAVTVKGSLSFILLSNKPVFSVETSKKAWLITVVAAVGNALNQITVTGIPAEEVIVTDVALMKGTVAFTLPADLVKSLQTRVKSDQMKLDSMYFEIQKNLKRKTIPHTGKN